MKNKKMNKYILWGVLINFFPMAINQFVEIPDAVSCFGTGMGISLVLFGIYAMSHDITKLQNRKRNLFKNI